MNNRTFTQDLLGVQNDLLRFALAGKAHVPAKSAVPIIVFSLIFLNCNLRVACHRMAVNRL